MPLRRAWPIRNKSSYIAHACTIVVLGAFYILSPQDWYGPSWSYFATHGMPILPAGGKGLGACLFVNGCAQLFILYRNTSRGLATLFFLSGFTFWMAAFLLGAEGLMGHRGIQEAPLLFVIGAFKFVTMSVLIADRRKERSFR
ncbi:hypothetical protein [Mycobacterium colombiense]